MSRKKTSASSKNGDDAQSYALPWPSSQRWNAQYNVPRNSLDSSYDFSSRATGLSDDTRFESYRQKRTLTQSSQGLSQDPDNLGRESGKIPVSASAEEVDEHDEFSNLSHWLETLAELYMNNIDNRARWDPRWLNITHRERLPGLASAAITIVDYLPDGSSPRVESISGKRSLATALQTQPTSGGVRVILVSDLSRFVMGALGQRYSIDPEFWFEHLASSGYAASDSHLKISSAVWMNFSEHETRFRHRALPGPGQRTEWNVPRRTRGRCWTHMRWARLGLLHYLGKKGFHEDELEWRIADGRWVVERDVVLDKYGRLVTKKRQVQMDRAKAKRAKKGKNKLPKDDNTSSRTKGSNVYRPYSTFEGLPKNISSWKNRDLRVMAPEGASYWSGKDDDGNKTIILLFDPTRNMKTQKTNETTPSLTFMPRAMELESYSEEDLWRSAGPEETYLDPPPAPLSSKEMKNQKKEATKQRFKTKKNKIRDTVLNKEHDDAILEEAKESDSESDYTSDSEYDEDYQKELRSEYRDPKPHSRDRDFARKYSLGTHDLVVRYLTTIKTTDLAEDNSVIPSILTRLVFDDLWRILAEIRLELDHLDGDFGGNLYEQLVEQIGNSTRQNLNWIRDTLKDLHVWTADLSSSSTLLSRPPDLEEELNMLNSDLKTLRRRAEQTVNLLASSMALAQSTLVIDQTSGINKLTELAFFFIPISFITSIFSMQVHELITSPPRLWTWAVSLTAVAMTTYFIRSLLRSPSVRVAVGHCRATIINRFSSASAGSASRRLNTVGNRAIAKFLFFLICVLLLVGGAIVAGLFFAFLVFGAIWLGAAATALYFIITRWPDPAVLVPCFLSLPLAAGGMWLTLWWNEEIMEWVLNRINGLEGWIRWLFPERWTLDSVDDDDLAKEGVNTYARQALVLAT